MGGYLPIRKEIVVVDGVCCEPVFGTISSRLASFTASQPTALYEGSA